MNRSRTVSLASFAALSLPLAGVGVAAFQQFTQQPQVLVAGSQAEGATLAMPWADGTDPAAPGSPISVPAGQASSEAIDPLRGWLADDLDAYGAYWEAGYNYRQLLALAEEWNLSEFEAKGRAGTAILNGDTSSFDAIVAGIEPGPEELPFDQIPFDDGDQLRVFWDAGYDYDDALELAEEWNTEAYEAKVLAASLIEQGDQGEIEAILARS